MSDNVLCPKCGHAFVYWLPHFRLSVVDEANKVLHTFAPHLKFLLGSRLWLIDNRKNVSGNRLVRVSKDSGALVHYHKLGMGGNMAMAVGQLARWIRGQSRVPLTVWDYLTGEKIRLSGNHGQLTIDYLYASSYEDGKSTMCVLCGGSNCGDWYSKDELVGPCCAYGKCGE